jgi:hypothetical protein
LFPPKDSGGPQPVLPHRLHLKVTGNERRYTASAEARQAMIVEMIGKFR